MNLRKSAPEDSTARVARTDSRDRTPEMRSGRELHYNFKKSRYLEEMMRNLKEPIDRLEFIRQLLTITQVKLLQ